MQETKILKRQMQEKKRQRFLLRKSQNIFIKRQSKKENLSKNGFLFKSVMEFLEAYKRQNIFFYNKEILE